MTHPLVMLVDDDVGILNALNRLLRNEPYKVICATSAEEALSLLESHEVNVIISDHQMPETTGVEFLKQVKQKYPEIVRVILSGHTDINLLIEAINKDEVYRFLTKPWNDLEVKTVIRNCLAHHDLSRKSRNYTPGMPGFGPENV